MNNSNKEVYVKNYELKFDLPRWIIRLWHGVKDIQSLGFIVGDIYWNIYGFNDMISGICL